MDFRIKMAGIFLRLLVMSEVKVITKMLKMLLLNVITDIYVKQFLKSFGETYEKWSGGHYRA